jgi:hypothetical protein
MMVGGGDQGKVAGVGKAGREGGREDKGGRKENKEKENKIIFYF